MAKNSPESTVLKIIEHLPRKDGTTSEQLAKAARWLAFKGRLQVPTTERQLLFQNPKLSAQEYRQIVKGVQHMTRNRGPALLDALSLWQEGVPREVIAALPAALLAIERAANEKLSEIKAKSRTAKPPPGGRRADLYARELAQEAAIKYVEITGLKPRLGTKTPKQNAPGSKRSQPSGDFHDFIKAIFVAFEYQVDAEHYAEKAADWVKGRTLKKSS